MEYERSKLETVKRTGSKTFEVEMKVVVDSITLNCPPFDVDDAEDFKDVPLPLFLQTRVVTAVCLGSRNNIFFRFLCLILLFWPG